MIPVFQTMTLANDGRGNCYNACVASILERPLRDVANILPGDGSHWAGAWADWFKSQGITRKLTSTPPRGFSIASGRSSRLYPEGHRLAGERIHHACVAFDGVVVHDPFPIPGGFDEITLYETLVSEGRAERLAA